MLHTQTKSRLETILINDNVCFGSFCPWFSEGFSSPYLILLKHDVVIWNRVLFVILVISSFGFEG